MRHITIISLIAFLIAIHFPAFGAVNEPAAPSDPTKPATATWVEGSWIVTGDKRVWQPAHWQVDQGSTVTVQPASLAQQVVYVNTDEVSSANVLYVQPALQRQVNIYAGYQGGVTYQVPVYQPQCTVGYYSGYQRPCVAYPPAYAPWRPSAPGTNCHNYSPFSAGIVLYRPGRGY